jgi:hypothetical protein
MDGSSSNSSFIPKRGTSKHKRRVRSGNVYILTLISYVLLFGALIASGAVFFYASIMNGQLQDEITAMNQAVNEFNQADLLQVQQFNDRLIQVENRLNNAGSVLTILEAIEASTIDTVRISSLDLQRQYDEQYVIETQIETDTFDSAIFQRRISQGNPLVGETEYTDVTLQVSTNEDSATIGQALALTALIAVPVGAVVPPTDSSNPTVTTPPVVPAAATTQPPVEVDAAQPTTEVETESANLIEDGV